MSSRRLLVSNHNEEDQWGYDERGTSNSLSNMDLDSHTESHDLVPAFGQVFLNSEPTFNIAPLPAHVDLNMDILPGQPSHASMEVTMGDFQPEIHERQICFGMVSSIPRSVWNFRAMYFLHENLLQISSLDCRPTPAVPSLISFSEFSFEKTCLTRK